MRRYIFASHHKLANGLKDTVQFLNNYSDVTNNIYDINAYVEENESECSQVVHDLFSTFSIEDEVIVLTDMMGGSVNQLFLPYMNERVHVITGMNLALAMSLILLPENVSITNILINKIVEDCKQQVIYVNEIKVDVKEDDE